MSSKRESSHAHTNGESSTLCLVGEKHKLIFSPPPPYATRLHKALWRSSCRKKMYSEWLSFLIPFFTLTLLKFRKDGAASSSSSIIAAAAILLLPHFLSIPNVSAPLLHRVSPSPTWLIKLLSRSNMPPHPLHPPNHCCSVAAARRQLPANSSDFNTNTINHPNAN